MATYNNTAIHGPVSANSVSVVMQSTTANQQPVTSLRNVEDAIMTFVGRQKLLDNVKEKLDSSPPSGNWIRRVTVLQGFGGMGKSELVRRFCEQYRDEYPNVAWIDAETEASLKKSFEGVSEILNLPSHESKTTVELANRVFGHVGEHIPKALFIYDNANCLKGNENNHFGIFDYLPRKSHGNNPLILVTSRTTEWRRERIEVIEVDGLSDKESVEFFQKRFEVTDEQLSQDKRLDRLLNELSEHLQGYPLGLQLAAGNINYVPEEDSVSILHRELEAFVDKVGQELSRDVLNMGVDTASDYPRSFGAVWNMTMKRLQQNAHYPKALHLLRIIAYCDPDAISLVELRRIFDSSFSNNVQDSVDNSEFDYAKKPLIQLALLRMHDTFDRNHWLRSHRVIQRLARQEDGTGIGLRSLTQAKSFESLNYYLSLGRKVTMPLSILEDDELTVAWLKLLGIILPQPPYDLEFEFDDTHVKRLQDRNCGILRDILMMAKFIKSIPVLFRHNLWDNVLLGSIERLESIDRGSKFFADFCTTILTLMNVCVISEWQTRGLRPDALQKFRNWLDLQTTQELAGCRADCFFNLQTLVFHVSKVVGNDKRYEDYGYNRENSELGIFKKNSSEFLRNFSEASLREVNSRSQTGWFNAGTAFKAALELLVDESIIAQVALRTLMEYHSQSFDPIKEKLKTKFQSSLKRWLEKLQSAEVKPDIEEKFGSTMEAFVHLNGVVYEKYPLIYKFMFEHFGSKHVLCVKKYPTYDEAHQSRTLDDLETISLAIYSGYMNCFALALKEHSATREPLETLLNLWLPDQNSLGKLPREARISLLVFPVMWDLDWDLQLDFDMLTQTEKAVSANKDNGTTIFHETVVTLKNYNAALIKFNEYFGKLLRHLNQRPEYEGRLSLWAIQWAVLFASSDDWMTHFV